MQKTHATLLHSQSNDFERRLIRILAQQLAILTAEHQRDWDVHLPLNIMAYLSAVQDSAACMPAQLMLGREMWTPAEPVFGVPLMMTVAVPGRDYA